MKAGTIVATLFRLCIVMALCGWLPAASVLDFPRLTFEPDVLTGIAITNPNSEDATVVLTAYGADGSVLAVREVVIPAGRQLSTVLRELFGSGAEPATVGWVQGFSMSSGLTGFFLILNSSGTEFDGADLPPRARRLAFNQVRVGGGFTTELNLANTGGEAAQVQLSLVGAGEEPILRELELPAMGAARLEVGEYFGQAEVPAGAFVLATSGEDLIGFELVRVEGGDVQGLNARNAAEFLNALYFPQVSVLGQFEARLGLVNHSSQAVIVQVTAHGPDGQLFVQEVRANPVAVSLAPGQSLNEDLVELFGFQGEEPLEGWLEVTSTSAAINGYLELRVPGTGAAANLTPVSQGSNRAVFSHLATSLGFFTGMALLNSGTLPADVRVVVQSVSGQVLGTFDAVLQPGQRISRMLTDIVPEAGGQAGGLFLVRSSLPIFASALFGTEGGSVLSNIPAQRTPGDFEPDAGIPVPQVVPRLAILQTGRSQEFRVEQLPGTVQWLVNGVPGGDDTVGTITPAGVYTAPAEPPAQLPVVITAVAGPQSAGGSVDVISLQDLVSGLGFVQSLAFLGSLQRLYTAELGALGGFAAGTNTRRKPLQGLVSTIFGTGEDGERVPVVDVSDEVPKMIPFRGRDGQEYLLAAGLSTGQVLRIDPRSGDSRVVATGLVEPGALVLDPVTGNLLVAEAEQVTSIPRRNLESDLTPAVVGEDGPPAGPKPSLVALAPIGGVTGIVVDACTGKLFLAQGSRSRLVDFERDSGESDPILEGLASPGQMAGLYRAGVSCPDSFQLLIVEEEADQVTLLVPSTGNVVSPWIPDVDVDDITLLPEDSPFEGRVAFDQTTEDDGGGGQMTNSVAGVPLPGLYDESPINPPQMEIVPFSVQPPGPDLAANGSTASPGASASVNVFYRPGDEDGLPAGPDETNILLFTIDYDETRLRFDPRDSNNDGLPDAVVPNTPGGFEVFVAFDANAREGELGFFVFDPSGSAATLPEGNLLTVSFRVLAGSVGTADLEFSPALPPQGADSAGERFSFDEVADGSVSIAP